jgi:hypothetical protein
MARTKPVKSKGKTRKLTLTKETLKDLTARAATERGVKGGRKAVSKSCACD